MPAMPKSRPVIPLKVLHSASAALNHHPWARHLRNTQSTVLSAVLGVPAFISTCVFFVQLIAQFILLGYNLAFFGLYALGTYECEIGEGNPDLYGVGIRISIYLQAVFALYLKRFSPHHILALRPSNAWFLFAFCIITCIEYWKFGSSTMDASMIIVLGGCLAFIVNSEMTQSDAEYDTAFNELCRLVLWSSWVSVYSVSVWGGLASPEWSFLFKVDVASCSTWNGILSIIFFTLLTIEWYQLLSQCVPHIALLLRLMYLIWKKDDKVDPPGRSNSCTFCHRGGVPPKRVIFRDMLFVLPLGQVKSVISEDWNETWAVFLADRVEQRYPRIGVRHTFKLAIHTHYENLWTYLQGAYSAKGDPTSTPCRWSGHNTQGFQTASQTVAANGFTQVLPKSPQRRWVDRIPSWLDGLNDNLVIWNAILWTEVTIGIRVSGVNEWAGGQIIAFVTIGGTCLLIMMQMKFGNLRLEHGTQ